MVAMWVCTCLASESPAVIQGVLKLMSLSRSRVSYQLTQRRMPYAPEKQSKDGVASGRLEALALFLRLGVSSC